MNHKNLFKDLETLREIVITYVLGQEASFGQTKELEEIKKLVNSDSHLKTIISEQNFQELEKFEDIKKLIEFASKNLLSIFEELRIVLIALKKDYYYIFFK